MAAAQPVLLSDCNTLQNATTTLLDITSLKAEVHQISVVDLKEHEAADESTAALTDKENGQFSNQLPAEHKEEEPSEETRIMSKVAITGSLDDDAEMAADTPEREPNTESKPEPSIMFDSKSKAVSAVKYDKDKVEEGDEDDEDEDEDEDEEERWETEEELLAKQFEATINLIPDIKRVSMDKWKTSGPSSSWPSLDDHVIVVYHHSATAIQSTDFGPNENDSPPSDAKTMYDQKLQKEPQRIRINSSVLVKELSRISDHATVQTPMIMVPPFKLLVVKAKEIEESLATKKLAFERKHGSGESSDSNIDALVRPLTEGQSKSEEESTEKETERQQEKVLVDHLQVLADYMVKELGQEIERRQNIVAGKFKKLAFEHLWHLFNPGDIVFVTKKAGGEDYPRAHCVYHVTGGRRAICCREDGIKEDSGGKVRDDAGGKDYKIGMTNPLYVDCASTSFNGDQYFHVGRSFCIKPYEGEKEIGNLPIYPQRYATSRGSDQQSLLERGKKFRALDRVAHRYYDGLTTGEIEEIHGEVIVDFKTGYRFGNQDEPVYAELPLSSPHYDETQEGTALCDKPWCTVCKTSNYDDNWFDYARHDRYYRANRQLFHVLSAEHDVIPDRMLQTLPRDVLAYELRSRKWRSLDINLVKDLPEEKAVDSGFDKLVLPEGHKELLLALLRDHSVPSGAKGCEPHLPLGQSSSMDIVRGKGKGKIILLHGAPGVGKTSTAETVAAFTKRPLYPITCADIGQTPDMVEENMEKHFKLAHKWRCILLIDEADVFLEKRERGKIVRNALVSVFLRILEYYPGILFLTTNRVGTFDEAFKSRIHLPLYYPRLDLKSTRKLWENCFGLIHKRNEEVNGSMKRPTIDYDKKEIMDFAESHYYKNEDQESTWNGRQIRNAFQTAIALAEYDLDIKIAKSKDPEQAAQKKKYQVATLKKSHFKKVSKATTEFDRYIRLAHQDQTDANLARDDGIRYDEWSPEKEYIAKSRSSQRPTPLREQLSRKSVAGAETPTRNGKKKREMEPESPVSDSESDGEDSKEDTSSDDE